MLRDAGSFNLSNTIREAAHPLTGASTDYDPLMRLVDDARFVFSRQHEGWLVTVEVLGEEIGAQVEAEEKPLEGITAELKGGGEDSISIIVGRTPAEHVTHNITAPTHVRIEQAENRADMALQIESSEGVTTLVRLRSAMLPEMVDGIIAEQ